MSGQRFRKKQVEVEAVQWTGENREEVEALVQTFELRVDAGDRLYVGSRSLARGDYLVRESSGAIEVYAPDGFHSFEDTYEPAEPQPSSNEKLRRALEIADGALMNARGGLHLGLGCARDLEDDGGMKATKPRSARQALYLENARKAHAVVRAALREETP